MDSMSKKRIDISDIKFNPVTENEIEIITKNIHMKNKKSYIHFFIYSSVIFIIAGILEAIGRLNSNREKSIPGMIFFLVILYIIVVALYYGYLELKAKMFIYSSGLLCVYGNVTEKFSAYKLSEENHTKSKNYILFDTDDIYCTTAIAIDDYELFKALKPNSFILIVKNCIRGRDSLTVYSIKNASVSKQKIE